MKSNSTWRARAAQSQLPVSNMGADGTPSHVRRGLSGMLTSVLRLVVVFVMATLASGPSFAQRETGVQHETVTQPESGVQHESGGYPVDWTHHRMVISDPGTLAEASGRGSFDAWYNVVTNPRFTFQRYRRGVNPRVRKGNQAVPTDPLGRDWSASLGGGGVAPDVYPAKWQFSVTSAPTCSDYVVFPVNKAGVSGSQPNLVGYQNLYVNATNSGFCPGTAPTVLFSYYVGTGTVQTSPVLGSTAGQVLYVESIAGGSKLHVLKGAGTGAANSNGAILAPVAPGTGGSTASDVFVTLNGNVNVTRSSPYYDYADDVAYVGDDNGILHKITPVFNGVPAEVTTGGWPVTVSTGASKILTGPVRNLATGLVYVGDSQGYLYSVSPTGAKVQSGQLGTGTGIVEAPIVDPVAKTVYVFVGDSAVSVGSSAVFVFNISSGDITAGSTGSSVTVGTNSATIPMYAGAFDNIYYSSSNGTQPAGNLYVCGNTGGNPTLYRIPITYSSGPVLGSVVTGPALASSNVPCSPLTEFYNSSAPAKDWLFAGVPATACGAGTGAGGCVMSFNITAVPAPWIGPWTPNAAFASGSQVVDTSGNIQNCTGGGCGAAGSTSGASTPAWTLTTTTEGTTTNATSIGTVNANSAVAGATVTIGSLTLTASAPTKASSPILINAIPGNGNTLTINGVKYDWHTRKTACAASPQKCVQRGATAAATATNLNNAIAGTCFNGACAVDPTVTGAIALATPSTVTVTAIIPGTGANADALLTSNTGAIHINGGAHASTTLGNNTAPQTGIPGTDGSNVVPNFQYWSGAAAVSTATLASNISAAAAGNSANVTLTYTSGSGFTASGTGSNAGAPGNSVAVGGTLTGFTWNPTGHLAGGTSALTWSFQAASNGQTSAPESTGTSGIIIDNVGTAGGEASIYSVTRLASS